MIPLPIDIDNLRLVDIHARGRGGIALAQAIGSQLRCDIDTMFRAQWVRRVDGRWLPADWPDKELTIKVGREAKVQRGKIGFLIGDDEEPTTLLSVDCVLADIETTLNTLTVIEDAGGIEVLPFVGADPVDASIRDNPICRANEGRLVLKWKTPGAKPDIQIVTQGLEPLCYPFTRVLHDCEDCECRQVIVHLSEQRLAHLQNWADVEETHPSIARAEPGGIETREVQRLTIPGQWNQGEFRLTFTGTKTRWFSVRATPHDICTALAEINSTLAPRVRKSGRYTWEFLFTLEGAQDLIGLETNVMSHSAKTGILRWNKQLITQLTAESKAISATLQLKATDMTTGDQSIISEDLVRISHGIA